MTHDFKAVGTERNVAEYSGIPTAALAQVSRSFPAQRSAERAEWNGMDLIGVPFRIPGAKASTLEGPVLGIDPGLSGAWAALWPGGKVTVGNLPIVGKLIDGAAFANLVRSLEPRIAIVVSGFIDLASLFGFKGQDDQGRERWAVSVSEPKSPIGRAVGQKRGQRAENAISATNPGPSRLESRNAVSAKGVRNAVMNFNRLPEGIVAKLDLSAEQAVAEAKSRASMIQHGCFGDVVRRPEAAKAEQRARFFGGLAFDARVIIDGDSA